MNKKIVVAILLMSVLMISSFVSVSAEEAPVTVYNIDDIFTAVSGYLRGEVDDYRLDNMTRIVVPTLHVEGFELRRLSVFGEYGYNMYEFCYYSSSVNRGDEHNAKNHEQITIIVKKKDNSFLGDAYDELHEKINDNVYRYVDQSKNPTSDSWYVNCDNRLVKIYYPKELGYNTFEILKTLVDFDIYEINEMGVANISSCNSWKEQSPTPVESDTATQPIETDTPPVESDTVTPPIESDTVIPPIESDTVIPPIESDTDTDSCVDNGDSGCNSTLAGIAIIPTALAAGLVIFRKRKK